MITYLTRFQCKPNSLQLKRQHSAELNEGSPATRKSPASNTPTRGSTPPLVSSNAATPPTLFTSVSQDLKTPKLLEEGIVGSPLKKQRASLSGLDDEAMRQRLGLGLSGMANDVMERIEQEKDIKTEEIKTEEPDEEL